MSRLLEVVGNIQKKKAKRLLDKALNRGDFSEDTKVSKSTVQKTKAKAKAKVDSERVAKTKKIRDRMLFEEKQKKAKEQEKIKKRKLRATKTKEGQILITNLPRGQAKMEK